MIEKEKSNSFDTKYKYIKGNDAIGYIETRTLYENTDIINVFVEESHRRQGIGSLLLKKVIDDNKNKVIMLEVKEDNVSAIKLYEKFGFKKISERKKYYKDKTAYIMSRSE